MGIEIERKFLVVNDIFKNLACGTYYKQGYLRSDVNCTVRVRIYENNAFLTLKSAINGLSRLEYEYPIPLNDAEEILNNLCKKPLIEKYRYKIEHEGFIWEIDEFKGDNEGLCIAEIELPSEDTVFIKPDFIGDEVTKDKRFYNSNLVMNPHKNWKNK